MLFLVFETFCRFAQILSCIFETIGVLLNYDSEVNNLSIVNDRIRCTIEEKEITFRKLEELTGISKATIQRYASGKTQKISLGNVELIAKALNVQSAYLMGWTDQQDKTAVDDMSDVKRQLIAKIKLMDEETIATLNKLADTILSKRDQ